MSTPRFTLACCLLLSAMPAGAAVSFGSASSLAGPPMDQSGIGLTPLVLNQRSCGILPGASGALGVCKASAWATSNWIMTAPAAAGQASGYNTAPVTQVRIDWGDGSYSTLTKTRQADGRPLYGAAHNYTRIGDYLVTAQYTMADPTSSGGMTFPVIGLEPITGRPPPGGTTYNGTTLQIGGNLPLSSGCHEYHYSANFNLSQATLDTLAAFTLSSVNYDDWLLVKVNGHIVYGGPRKGTTELIASGNGVTWAPGKVGACDQDRDWRASPNANAIPYLKPGANSITIDYVLAGNGTIGMRFDVAAKPHCDTAGCSNATTFRTHQAQAALRVYNVNDPPVHTLTQNATGGVLTHPIPMPASKAVSPLPPDAPPSL